MNPMYQKAATSEMPMNVVITKGGVSTNTNFIDRAKQYHGEAALVFARSYLSTEMTRLLQSMLYYSGIKMALTPTINTMVENISIDCLVGVQDKSLISDLIFNEFLNIARDVTLQSGIELKDQLNSIRSEVDVVVSGLLVLLKRAQSMI